MDAALLLPPYYFASAPEGGLERWLRVVLEAARLPVYLCASDALSPLLDA